MNSRRTSPEVSGRPLFLWSISPIGNGISARQSLGSAGTVSGQNGEPSGDRHPTSFPTAPRPCLSGAAHPGTLSSPRKYHGKQGAIRGGLWARQGTYTFRESQVPGNQVYSAPVGGVGLPSRKSLKSSRERVVSFSWAPLPKTTSEGAGQRVLPFSTPQTRESTLSDLPEAPAQGGRSTTVFGTRTPTCGPPHPALADAGALESFFGGGGLALSSLLSPPPPVSPQLASIPSARPG